MTSSFDDINQIKLETIISYEITQRLHHFYDE